jgi:hypothetical protein
LFWLVLAAAVAAGGAVHDRSVEAGVGPSTEEQGSCGVYESGEGCDDERENVETKESELDVKERMRMQRIQEVCGEMHQSARALFDEGKSGFAVEKLIECTERLPEELGVFWEVGMLLTHLKEHAEAVRWLQQALVVGAQYDPSVLQPWHYAKAAATAHDAGKQALAVKLQSVGIELAFKLEPGTWTVTLEKAARATKQEDVDWITADETGTELFHKLATMYIDAHDRKRALLSFSVLLLLYPDHPNVHRSHATYLMQMGRIGEGLVLQTQNTVRQLSEFESDAQTNMLLLLTTGLEQMSVLLGQGLLRNNIMHTDPELLASLRSMCNVELDMASLYEDGKPAIGMIRVKAILSACIEQQGVVAAAVAAGGSLEAANAFGYRPLHHAVLFGDLSFLRTILDQGPDLTARTTLRQTALHLASLRGDVAMAEALVRAGVPEDGEDRSGRTAEEVMAIAVSLKDPPTDRMGCGAPPPSGGSGGWAAAAPVAAVTGAAVKVATSMKAEPARCAFNIVQVEFADPETFLLDYVMQQRPVLVRGALTGSGRMGDALRERWSRASFAKLFGHVEVQSGEIPYAAQFGHQHNLTTIIEHLEYMHSLQSVTPSVAGGQRRYVFQPIDAEQPPAEGQPVDGPGILDDLEPPFFLNRPEYLFTEKQLYLGPDGSGAPFHVHGNTYNALVHGKKRWALQPPKTAVYSVQDPLTLFSELDAPDDTNVTTAGVVLQCTQEAGDVMFIPGGWSHAVLNGAESVGWASEFVFGASQFGYHENVDMEPYSYEDDTGARLPLNLGVDGEVGDELQDPISCLPDSLQPLLVKCVHTSEIVTRCVADDLQDSCTVCLMMPEFVECTGECHNLLLKMLECNTHP